jgi:hypothetical protein
MTKTIQRHWYHWANKTQDEDNPETLVTLDKQDTGRRQSRDTGNIGQTRPRTSRGSCLSKVTSVSGLASSCVLFVQCYQCLWIVFVLGLVCPMLPVSLDCLRPVSCLSNVTSVSGLSSSCFLFVQCYQCLWIVFFLGLVCPMVPVSLDCLRPVSCLSNVTSVSGLSSSCFLFVQCYQWTKTIQRHW